METSADRQFFLALEDAARFAVEGNFSDMEMSLDIARAEYNGERRRIEEEMLSLAVSLSGFCHERFGPISEPQVVGLADRIRDLNKKRRSLSPG